jgi:hypothetical protein
MCQALLALDARFHDVQPRHPRGGKDGGRDLEARLTDGRSVWAGIGFRNSATDSAADRKWVKKKFSNDLTRALEVAPELKAFVFITNVELTIGERDALTRMAKRRGIDFVDVLHRERLRILLDSPDGLAARYQYLGISLSEEEQAAFFARWGTQIEQVISRQFAALDRKLMGLEFQQACGEVLRSLQVTIRLKRAMTPAEIGHFRATLRMMDYLGESPLLHTELIIRSEEEDITTDKKGIISWGVWVTPNGITGKIRDDVSTHSTNDPDSEKWVRARLSSFRSTYSAPVTQLRFGTDINGVMRHEYPIPKLGELHGCILVLLATNPLAAEVGSCELTANGYVVFESFRDELDDGYIRSPKVEDLWPDPLTSQEAAVPWLRVGRGIIDLRSATPRRRGPTSKRHA